MSKFNFTELVNSPMADIVSAGLGDGTVAFTSDTDLNKLVKMGASNNFVLTEDGDEIEGFVFAIEPITVNDGVSFGTVQRNKRLQAEVAAGVTTALVPGTDLVVSAGQAAPGTAGKPQVKKGTPATFKWRVIRIVSGTGVAGDTVLVERI